ncbi:MAG: alanine racemase [Oscillospiraceae bacterium]|jgi:alanine racemase|nr:alanine racemase [Oscillospiraceae bacterium]
MNYLKRTWADISLDNLEYNYLQLRKGLPASCRFLGVVKADAYGHGAVPMGHHLLELGAECLAVSNIEEAVQLRNAGIRSAVLILGYTPPFYAQDLTALNLCQEVHSLAYARQLSERIAGTGKRLRVHIKLDTGMSRLGFFAYDNEQTIDEIREIAQMPALHIEGIFTHFAVADSIDRADADFTCTQFTRFTAMLDALKAVGIAPKIRHCCNSGARILYPEYALDMIRPGIATYGVLPSQDMREKIDLRPVMALRSMISQIREFAPNITLSYGRTYTTRRKQRIAVVCIGYADGLSRSFSNNISFLLHGKRVALTGRVCMDMCMIDVTNVPEAKVGDTVTIFGESGQDCIEVQSLSNRLGTIPYEVLCGINKRIPRIYFDGQTQTEILQYIV